MGVYGASLNTHNEYIYTQNEYQADSTGAGTA
jgi:hypothetical protein